MPDFDEYLRYENGNLFWIVGHRTGKKAGMRKPPSSKLQYERIQICGVRYKLHRVVYALHYNDLTTELMIDHKNGNILDNRIENLRVVTNQQNQHNTPKPKGCSRSRNKWRSTICLDNKNIHLGMFDTEEEARQAYLKAKDLYHPTHCL